jgi:lipopolysaccharide/colanic/teichoic acid biosynthesis glycosyltransferase
MFAPSDLRPNAGPPPHEARGAFPEAHTPADGPYSWAKRAVDGTAACVLLLLTAPVIGIAMLLVKLTSRGPALYSQTRLGWHGRPFTIFKIRTMVHECESLTGVRWSAAGDTRITPVGRWLRKTHIDELPQLWNVLLGDMSLVGPRPERPEFVPRLEQALPRYRDRLMVRPGVTGLAQVQLPPDTDLGSVRAKLAYDLHYVRNLGFWYDLRICWATSLKMIGVPFRSIRWLFVFPSRETIDQEYSKLLAPARLRQNTVSRGQGPGVRSKGDSDSCILTPVS